MASTGHKLAESLEVLKEHQNTKNSEVVLTSEISRTHRERLVKAGFLKNVVKGWYIISNPNDRPGDSTSWYTNYWQFCSRYLTEKYKGDYCISADQSFLIHAGHTSVPQQLLVRSPKAPNDTITLLCETSLYILKTSKITHETEDFHGVKIMSRDASIVHCSATMFTNNAIEARTVLALVRDASGILEILLEGSHSVIAGRLAGAFRNIGKNAIADDIVQTMRAADYKVSEQDPFQSESPQILNMQERSPYANRIRLMWMEMRKTVVQNFPSAPGLPQDVAQYLSEVDEIYATDAYHSLSIERYTVTLELIEKVRQGDWDLQNEDDKNQRDAMAAKGYWDATQAVKKSIEKIVRGENSGSVFHNDHSNWYRQLFSPSILAGILEPKDLAGYRRHQVYIANSMHTPLNREAVLDAMPAFIDLLEKEKEASVRIVLGHFIFVFIHPYMDGNGRIARFIMNAMLASGGYPWTVIPVEKRDEYMAALEEASVHGNIEPFTLFLADLVTKTQKKKS